MKPNFKHNFDEELNLNNLNLINDSDLHPLRNDLKNDNINIIELQNNLNDLINKFNLNKKSLNKFLKSFQFNSDLNSFKNDLNDQQNSLVKSVIIKSISNNLLRNSKFDEFDELSKLYDVKFDDGYIQKILNLNSFLTFIKNGNLDEVISLVGIY